MRVKVKIITNSSQAEIIPQPDGDLKIKVKSAPVDNKANIEMIKLLAKYYKVSPSQISIIRGKTAKNKLIKVEN